MKIFSGYDLGVVIPTALLLVVSLIVLSSIDLAFFQTQLLFVLLGSLLFVVLSSINIRVFQRLPLPLYIGSILLLVSIFIIGIDVRGAKRWIELFGARMQFSEIAKPFLIVAFASLLEAWKGKISLRRVALAVVFFGPIALLLLKQPDLGSVLVYGSTFVFMLLTGGMSVWYIFAGLLIFALSFPLLFRLLADYQKNRILTFLNPAHDPLGIGYNAIQSAIAVGSGLLLGRGLGRGVQSQLSFLPERHTDFIFATFSEEFGFLGTLVILALYFFLLLRILRIATSARSIFESYVAYGAFALLLFQTFINIGMNMGIVPITGVTLPLFSYGGSSLISTLILLGIVHAISRGSKREQRILEIR